MTPFCKTKCLKAAFFITLFFHIIHAETLSFELNFTPDTVVKIFDDATQTWQDSTLVKVAIDQQFIVGDSVYSINQLGIIAKQIGRILNPVTQTHQNKHKDDIVALHIQRKNRPSEPRMRYVAA